VYDLFKSEVASNPEDWADELRDRLGLYHLNPFKRPSREIHIFVFRYPVGALPRLVGKRDVRLIAVPTVLDGWFSEAFCPAPARQSYGHVVYLGEQPYKLRRELLHPVIHFKAEQLFKVGKLTRPVPTDLTAARKEHLRQLRVKTRRADYAKFTDGDLL
jgi:hypothetical protein